jgi:hypothetical protein
VKLTPPVGVVTTGSAEEVVLLDVLVVVVVVLLVVVVALVAPVFTVLGGVTEISLMVPEFWLAT